MKMNIKSSANADLSIEKGSKKIRGTVKSKRSSKYPRYRKKENFPIDAFFRNDFDGKNIVKIIIYIERPMILLFSLSST